MVTENSIDKYLQGIVVINATLGRLDVLKLHLRNSYNDTMSDVILDSVIRDLSNICGVEYNTIELNNTNATTINNNNNNISNKKQNQDIKTTKKTIEPMVIEVVEVDDTKPTQNNKATNAFNKLVKKDNGNEANIANATLQSEVNNTKTIKPSEGVQIDDRTGNMVYKFVNSNTLNYVLYNRSTKTMTVNFVQNGRTYEYYRVSMYMFDNMVNIDEAGGSAGAYFQQNIALKWKKGMYKEITDTQLIG